MLLTPTRIYVQPILELLEKQAIKGMTHITGGGFYDNVSRVLPQTALARFHFGSWSPGPVFDWLRKEGGLGWEEILQIFNQAALNFYSSNSGTPSNRSSGDPIPEDRIAELAHQLVGRGVKTVVVTRSAQGGLVCSRGGKTFAFKSFTVKAVDSTGARDAFCAALSVGMAEGMPPERAVRFAAGAGALACTRFGAQPSMPWRHEVEAIIQCLESSVN